jgi:hypothetical protein
MLILLFRPVTPGPLPAHRCNRCAERCYTNDDFEESLAPTGTPLRQAILQALEVGEGGTAWGFSSSFDLCTHCYDSLREWLSNEGNVGRAEQVFSSSIVFSA